MSKVTRYSSMHDGGFCAIMIDGKMKNQQVRTDKDGKLYVIYKGKKYSEDEMPMGEEVEV